MNTPRGITLSGTFVQPVDSRDAAVLFSHSFLADEHSGGHYDELARAYRKAGYATLQFDYSGHGRSDDEVITRESQIEDLQAASGWLADQGFAHQIIHGHSFGSVTALAAHLIHATALFLSAPVLGPLSYDWSAIFSDSQLDELEHTGQTQIPDDSDGPREFFTISKQTLADLSMVQTALGLNWSTIPVLVPVSIRKSFSRPRLSGRICGQSPVESSASNVHTQLWRKFFVTLKGCPFHRGRGVGAHIRAGVAPLMHPRLSVPSRLNSLLLGPLRFH